MTVNIEKLYELSTLLNDLGARVYAQEVNLTITEINRSRSGLARANVVAKKVHDRFSSIARGLVGPDYALGFDEACKMIVEAAEEVQGEVDLVADNQRLRAALQTIADLPTQNEISQRGLDIGEDKMSYSRIIEDVRDALARKVGT